MYRDQEIISFMVAILMSCVTAYVSIVRKVMRKRGRITKLWLSSEVMMCLLAFLIALELYPHLASLMPAFMTKAIFASTCVHMSSRLVMFLEERVNRALSSS